ncbi:MAG: hypothetical protein GY809_26325 [Planctomycetes bacterium]|nr:hypothetical protein [Planctomycetota bacterium]
MGDLDLTLKNFADTTSHWVAGRYGRGLQFDGVNDYAFNATGTAPFAVPIDHTVALWIKYDAENVGRTQRWLSWGGQDGSWGRYYMGIHANGDFSVGIGAGTVKTETSIEPPSSVVFEHWAAVYASGELTIYRNGLDVPIASSGNISGEVHPISTTLPFVLGRLGLSYAADSARWIDATLDDVAIWDVALTRDEIKEAMKGFRPELASAPIPRDPITDVSRNVVLKWAAGEYAAKHDVYLGTGFDDVSEADRANPGVVMINEGQDANSYDTGILAFGQTYYWRVDEVNGAPDNTIFKGNVWSFEVEPYSISIPGSTIAVTASSSSSEFSTPDKTIDGSGLDANDMHAIAPETMWVTANVDLNPWIQYEFDSVKKLDTMTVWNSNGAAEAAIGWGVRNVDIAYSVDGENWNVLADANQFSRAPGLPTYDTPDEIAFGGVAAKVVRLNIQSNWGGVLMSYGLSEVQFSAIPVRARTPEPASESVDILPDSILTWRAGRDAAEHVIYMDTDMNAVTEGTAQSISVATNSLDLGSLDLELGQTYTWRVDEVNDAEAPSVWAGDVWNFSTLPNLTIDDFEGYNNISPDRPFQIWRDGIGYSADEFFPVAYEGNGTGAAIGHDIWSLGSPHFDATIMETTRVYGGSQSMPFYYSNTNATASETQRTFDVPQDWTASGIQSLSIMFYGNAGNTGQLYVKINNTNISYAGLPDALQRQQWVPWIIDLATTGADLTNVTNLTLGIEGASAAGVIYLDEIRLYPLAPETIEPVLPNDNDPALVAYYEFEGNANDSVGTYHGTVEGDPVYTAGKLGQAISLDEIDDHVVHALAQEEVWSGYSVCLWAQTDLMGQDLYSGLFNNNSSSADFQIEVNGSDTYLYRGATTGAFGPVSSDWVHLTATCDGAQTHLYYNGLQVGILDVADTRFGQLAVGINRGMSNRFGGTIDEVRVYDRPLSMAEVAGLAGLTDDVPLSF